jgi:predicted transposase/invertase (TIGR01784 family)
MSDLISFDYAIKYLLKNKGDYEIVEGFISAILTSQGYAPVKITAILESESNKEDRIDKKSIADVVVSDTEGHKYIVEIDRSHTNLFLHKACFNSSRLIIDSLSSAEDYSTIKKVFHINLLYSSCSAMQAPLYHGKTIFRVADEHPINIHLADMGMRKFDADNILPEFFIISVPLFDDIIKREIDEWLYLLKHSEIKAEFKSPYMQKIAERLNILKMSPAERAVYNAYMNKSLKERDYLVAATEKGKVEGEQIGLEKGKAEGEQIGFNKAAREVAKKLLQKV